MKFFCHILEKTDDFDLGKYLMEGEEMDIGPDMDTPVSDSSFAIKTLHTHQVIEMILMCLSTLGQLS